MSWKAFWATTSLSVYKAYWKKYTILNCTSFGNSFWMIIQNLLINMDNYVSSFIAAMIRFKTYCTWGLILTYLNPIINVQKTSMPYWIRGSQYRFSRYTQVWDNSSTYKLMYPTCLCISNPLLCQFFWVIAIIYKIYYM